MESDENCGCLPLAAGFHPVEFVQAVIYRCIMLSFSQGTNAMLRADALNTLKMDNDQKQILIVGLPRSGTTWIGKLLDSSPLTLYLHEPDSFFRIPCLPYAPELADLKHWLPFSQRYLADWGNFVVLKHAESGHGSQRNMTRGFNGI